MRSIHDAPYTLLLDQGGHGTRALVVDERARRVAQAERAVETLESGSDRVEQDGREILSGLRECISEVREALGAHAVRIGRAGLAVQRGSVVCWDRHSGEVLSPVLSWRDRRTHGQALAGVTPEAVREITGLRFSPYGGAAKMAWCVKELPAVREALEQGRLAMGPLGAFLVFGMLDNHPLVVDHGLAQRTLLWSRHDGDWSARLLAAFDCPREALPELSDSRADFGAMRDLPDCRLALLMGDQNAVPWSTSGTAGGPYSDEVLVNMGTGAFMLRPIAGEHDAGPFQDTLLQRDREPGFALEASLHGAGSALRWLERASGRAIRPRDMEAALSRVAEPPLFRNSVDGLGSPWWQSDIEPAFVSQGRVVTVEELGIDNAISGLLESLAFLIRVNLDVMSVLAGPVDRLVLAGGLSQSPALCQRIAALTDQAVFRLDSVEATAMGLFHRLVDADAASEALKRVSPGRHDRIEQRYREWLSIMPPLPA